MVGGKGAEKGENGEEEGGGVLWRGREKWVKVKIRIWKGRNKN